ncbi:MAG: thymidine phosphorylase [Treponema sp.]
MNSVDVIMKKRGFHSHFEANTREEIEYMIEGYVKGDIPDYQISAYLMAVYFNGMNVEETSILTDVMLHSGDVIDLSSIRKGAEVFVDKHSTGGVGDKISLPLASIVASCGVRVPMMAGRALGYTGGTLDKLESIEGYRTNLTVEEFKNVIDSCGFSIMGQTDRVVPADKLLYALRDVSGTVESIPLITSSILSKKVAEGADAFCFDVKVGSGAFMKTMEDARSLAKSIVNTAHSLGKKSIALITDMNIPLGRKVGNFLEIEETLDVLENKAPSDVMDLTLSLSAHMLFMGEKASSYEDGLEKAKRTILSGKAYEVFLRNVEAQGGNVKKMLDMKGKNTSQYKKEITSLEDGFVESIDALTTGKACVKLGVGREKKTDPVFANAGIEFLKTHGEEVKKGDVIMILYGKDYKSLEEATFLMENSFKFSPKKPEKRSIIYETIF